MGRGPDMPYFVFGAEVIFCLTMRVSWTRDTVEIQFESGGGANYGGRGRDVGEGGLAAAKRG